MIYPSAHHICIMNTSPYNVYPEPLVLFNNTHESHVFFWLKKNLIYQKRNIIRIICLFDIILPETHARTYVQTNTKSCYFFFFFPIFHLFIHAQPHPILAHIYWLFFISLFLIAIIIYAFDSFFFFPPLLVVVVVVVTLYTRLFFFSLSPVSSQSHTSCFFFIIIGHVLFFFRAMTNPPPTHPLAPPRQFSFIKKNLYRDDDSISFSFFFFFLI